MPRSQWPTGTTSWPALPPESRISLPSPLPSTSSPLSKLWWSTTWLSCRPVASPLPPSRQFTLDPMQPRPQLTMQEDWRQSSAWPGQPVLCSPATSGLMLASSTEQWELSRPSVTGLEDHLTCPSLPWSALTATPAPPSLTAQYPSLLFAAPGLPQEAHAHVFSCPSSWHGQSPSTSLRVSPWTKREFSTGLTFVAFSCVHQLQDLLFTPPFLFQRLANLSKSSRLKERQDEDRRLQSLCHWFFSKWLHSHVQVHLSSSLSVLPCTHQATHCMFHTTIHPYTYLQCKFLVYLLIQVPMQDSAPHLSKYDLCPEQCDKSSWWMKSTVLVVKKESESPVWWKRPVFLCSGEEALFFHKVSLLFWG